MRGALSLAFGASILIGLAQPAQAQQVTTSSDPDDVGSRLDIRTVSVSPGTGDRSRITIVFWNEVSRWLLTHHLVQAEMGWDEKVPGRSGYYFHFMRTKNGLRLVAWEGGTCCPLATRAHHPDPFTYTGLTNGSVESYMPPPLWLRGSTSRRVVDCPRACYVNPSEMVDRTPWTHF